MNFNTVEKLLLIAHHPTKGRFFNHGFQIDYGIAGAILLDLSLENRIALEDGIIVLKKSGKTEYQLFSEVMAMISNSKKPRKIKHWIPTLARKSTKYKWHVLRELENKKVVQTEKKKFLGIIPYRRSYLTDSYTRNNLIQQLKNNILFSKELSNEIVAILGMVEACKMHSLLTSERDELHKIRKELKQIIKASPIADTVSKTIQEVQAAVLAAVIASTASAAAAAHH